MYKVFLHPDVDKFLKNMSAEAQINLMRTLRDLKSFGLTSMVPAYVFWNTATEATIFCSFNLLNPGMHEGLIVKIFYRRRFNKRYYIRSVEYYKNESGRDWETGLQSKLESIGFVEQRIGKYREIDQDEILRPLETPFKMRFLQTKHTRTKTHFTTAQEMELLFYGSPLQIIIADRVRKRHGSGMAFPPCFDEGEFVAFGRKAEYEGRSLSAFLQDQQKRHPHRLLLVDFVDETDPFSHAHRDYLLQIGLQLKTYYDGLDLLVVDVVIRDQYGKTAYFKEFERYRRSRNLAADHPSASNPFIMVVNKPVDRDQDNAALGLPERLDNRLLDIDLIHGIDHNQLTNPLETKPFAQNLARCSHQLFRIAGLTAHKVGIVVKDFRGMSEVDVASAIWKMSASNVIISCFHPEGSPKFRTVVRACADIILRGYPYITVLQCDQAMRPGAGARVFLYAENLEYEHDDLDNEAEIFSIQRSISTAYSQIPGFGNDDECETPLIQRSIG